jgi:hypothetical protein
MVSVNSTAPWPADEQLVEFAGRKIRLVPPRRDAGGELCAYPLAAIEHDPGDTDAALTQVIRRFLAAVSWRDQASIMEVDVSSGSPIRTGTRIPGNGTTTTFDANGLPDPVDNPARMALAFYAEGLALTHVHIAYSCLSFFKVLNTRFRTGPEQVKWINDQLAANVPRHMADRLTDIRACQTDVGQYLFGSGRCAVAHAFADPLVDPLDITDQQRLSRDLPVIRELAAALIRGEYGIPASNRQAAA